MDFIGTGRRLAQGDVGDAARVLGIETAVLLAFLEVEAAGRGFDSRARPKMLFEPHVLYRNTEGQVRSRAIAAGVAYRRWGEKPYPADSYPRLQTAIALAREPGFRSGSYGLPQILGENHRAAGFATAEQMFATFKQGEREQLLAMVALLQDWNMAPMLRGKDFTLADNWRSIASRYNGSGYATHGYHTKLAAAYRKHKAGKPMEIPPPAAIVILQHGMKGEAVRNLQANLQAYGYTFDLGVDGRFGTETEGIVRAFQEEQGLPVTGKADPATRAALTAALAEADDDLSPPPPEWPGQEPPPAKTGGINAKAIIIVIAAAVAIGAAVFIFGR